VSKLVAVTGATGFVGPHLVAALARRGWKIRLLVRRWSPLPSLAGVEADLVLGDVADEAALRRLVDGADTVIHAAGLIKARRAADFMAVNRDGTARVSALAPTARFVLLSSLAAREPLLSPYGASKRAAEDVVAGRSGPWLAVRAPAIYGPGDRETLAYFRAARRALLPSPAAQCQAVADPCRRPCRGVGACLERPRRPPVYEIDDGREGATAMATCKPPPKRLGRCGRCRSRGW
jgi:uncharacterized protein YbjT (DUF2867 family)